MTKLFKNFDIKDYNSLRLSTRVENFYYLEELNELYDLDYDRNLDSIMLGDGTNLIFSQEYLKLNCFFLAPKNDLKQIKVLEDNSEGLLVAVPASMSWDTLVEWSVLQGFYDLACLSLIPGRVGAAPVQNIGAYGSEIADSLVSLTVFNLKTQSFQEYSKISCQLAYRSSIFKPPVNLNYNLTGPKTNLKIKSKVITEVKFLLKNREYQEVNYPSLVSQLGEKIPTALELRDTIISIRNSKLPNYKITPNVGSFFKNPVLLNSEGEILIKRYGLKHFQLPDGKVKLMAGELLEIAGLKGIQHKDWGTYSKQSLVIVGDGSGNVAGLNEMINLIQNTIWDKFGLKLAIEPEII